MFTLDPSATTPIYRQIMDQVRRYIASGDLQPGESLPSVRSIATTLAVNPNTVSKAYSLLEHDGVLIRQRGATMTIAQPQDTGESLLAPTVIQLITEARQLGLSKTQLVKYLNKYWETDS